MDRFMMGLGYAVTTVVVMVAIGYIFSLIKSYLSSERKIQEAYQRGAGYAVAIMEGQLDGDIQGIPESATFEQHNLFRLNYLEDRAYSIGGQSVTSEAFERGIRDVMRTYRKAYIRTPTDDTDEDS